MVFLLLQAPDFKTIMGITNFLVGVLFMFCRACGKEFANDSKFCLFCGTPVAPSAPAAPAAPVAPAAAKPVEKKTEGV